MQSPHFYEPSLGHGLAHDPLNAIIAPRGQLAGYPAERRPASGPYSYFNLFNAKPPIIGFSSVGWKDNIANIKETGEFAWSLATRPLADRMNETSASVAPEVDEFALAGLTPAPSRMIAAPRVGESPASFECRLTQIIRLETKEGGLVDTWLVLGEVVGVHIKPEALKDGVYQTALLQPIMRGGGATSYFQIDPEAEFHMRRPRMGPP